MKQQVSVITLGIADLVRSKRFYNEGFGWKPIFENEEIAFYQMNGFVFSTWLQAPLEAELTRRGLKRPGSFLLAHNVRSRQDVEPAIARLLEAGGRLLREASEPDHGGFRGYVADPDDHSWEIAWNPAWSIDEQGHVTFGT